jgi:2-polyprenyl-3-methyl-5-hydroxy-6-metoxy-1,4-benzoquinol methylase
MTGPSTLSHGPSATFRQFQYDDLATKSQDVYADTKYRILQKYLRGHGRLRILNVGCGSGELSLQLAALGHQVTGIDIEPAYIALAEKNAAKQAAAGDCTFSTCAIEDFQSAANFDCVVSTDVLEHIEDDRTAFGRMMNLVTPGGLVLLTVPAGSWLFGYHDEQLGHFRRYSKKSLRQLVEATCEVRGMRYFGFTLVPACLLYSKWLRRSYPVAAAGDRQRSPLRSLVLRNLMRLDSFVPAPFGVSLLMRGVKKTVPLAA